MNDKWQRVLASIGVPHNRHFSTSKPFLENDGSLTIYCNPSANIEKIRTDKGSFFRQRILSEWLYVEKINYQFALPIVKAIPPPPPIRDTPGEFALLMLQERSEKDIISFKRMFVMMTGGDILAGILLSQIIFWHAPNKDGGSKLRVNRDGHNWIAKTSQEWSDDTMIKPRQIDVLIDRLVKMKLIIKKNFRFNGIKMRHIRINETVYLDQYHKAIRE